MNFRIRHREEPEINLIPFIDVLLVVLIFVMMTTTYSKVTELKINLPVANAQPTKPRLKEIVVVVSADGRYAVDSHPIEGRSVDLLAAALTASAGTHRDSVIVVTADASATHQSVINVMDAARRAGLSQLTFATQSQTEGGAGPSSGAANQP
ncbi:MAG: biopolymer transporter ExbD [Burkholderiales bacterium]|nr:biopolymer transporter ExbD [Burkholderiales bacterium]